MSLGLHLDIIWGPFGHHLRVIEIIVARGGPGGEAPRDAGGFGGPQAPQWVDRNKFLTFFFENNYFLFCGQGPNFDRI